MKNYIIGSEFSKISMYAFESIIQLKFIKLTGLNDQGKEVELATKDCSPAICITIITNEGVSFNATIKDLNSLTPRDKITLYPNSKSSILIRNGKVRDESIYPRLVMINNPDDIYLIYMLYIEVMNDHLKSNPT